jgi:signal transduction histidine kinase
MLDAYVDSEAGHKMLLSAQSVAERSAKLVKQLLAFARKQALYLEPVNLNHLILNMNDLLNSTLGRKIRIYKQLEDSVWLVSVDINQMEMIVLNLILNARDAMPQGGTLNIEIRNLSLSPLRKDLSTGEYVVLSVSDTGVGMSADVLKRVFEPFFTTKNVGHGTGLGLSQVHGTVKQLGGKIRLYSVLGGGTNVEIMLPRFKELADFVQKNKEDGSIN